MQTIQPFAKRLGASVTVHPELHEVFGVYSNKDEKAPTQNQHAFGLSKDEMVAQFGSMLDVSRVRTSGPWNEAVVEDLSHAIIRARNIAAWLSDPAFAEDNNGKCVVLVSHSNFLDILLCVLLALPFAEEKWLSVFRLANTSTTSLTIQAGKQPIINFVNRLDHVAAEQYSAKL
jgi:broad specificity phosphatase PhoE